MIGDGERPRAARKLLSHHALPARGITVHFVHEAVNEPTDWFFDSEDNHTIIMHREGEFHAMETVFDLGARGHFLPQPGDIWVLPAGHRHIARAMGDTVSYCELHVPAALLGGRPLDPRMGHRDPFLHHLIENLAALVGREDDAARMMRDLLGETMCLHLGQTYISAHRAPARRGAMDPALRRRLVDHIDETLGEQHDLASVAARAGMAIGDFIPAFSAAFGTTPHQYLIRRRILRARTLLAGTADPITDVALATGFSTPSHFASSFREHVGMTPSAYRRLARG